MISNHDRSKWFGASDTSIIMSNWDTKTFLKWWLVKLGITSNDFQTDAMVAGTAYEHRILDYLGVTQTDRQIRIRKYRLRVNLDGEDKTTIYEVKTHKSEVFKLSKSYQQQAQVEMFATGKRKLYIVAYHLLPEDYENFFNPIDGERISTHPVTYNEKFITEEYLPRLKHLAYCLNKRKTPNIKEIQDAN